MACDSIIALPRTCGADGIQGGLDKLYIIAFKDLEEVSTPASPGDVYTLSTGGIVNDIGVVGGKQFVEVGLLINSAGLNETMTKNLQNGTAFQTQTLTLPLAEITSANRTFVQSVMNQPVAFIVKSATGKHYAAGLNGKMELSGLEGGLGIAPGDNNGYTLTFTGIDKMLIPLVEDTVVSASIVAAPE